MPGPQRTPTETLKERGSWRGVERAKTEPPAIDREPSCPAFLKGEARREWSRRVASLKLQGLLSETYRNALAMFCQAWGEYYEVCRALNETGLLNKEEVVVTLEDESEDSGDEFVSIIPQAGVKDLLSLRKQAQETMLKLGPQFGWSPSTKSTISKPTTPPVGNNAPAEGDKEGRFTNASDFKLGVVTAS